MTIPPYPPDHFSILTPEMQRDWWRNICLELLEEASEQLHWAGYAGEYFQKKHDLAGDIVRLESFRKAIIAANK